MTEEIPRKFLEPVHPADRVRVKDFFKGKNVFITGATGFIGKALVEKLLRSCEDIGNLYLLIRPKKQETVQQRVDKMKKSPVFDTIRQIDERILSKLRAIRGDVSDIDLGLSTEDRRLLEDTVSVIFHGASSVRFDDPIKQAVLINVRGTRNVVDLAKGVKNLKVLVYVSTTYANSDKPVIDEEFHESNGVDWRILLKSVETLDEHMLDIITPKLIGGLPNTYTFTKKLAESIIFENRHELPMLIFRPSIVIGSVKEPAPGWVDNLNGPIGLVMGYLTGVFHCAFLDGDKPTDVIPCDYATNALIASAWYRGILNTSDCFVIHSASGDKTRVTYNGLQNMTEVVMEKVPFNRVLWHPSMIMTTNTFVYTILFYFTHLLPAIGIDILLRMYGEKFRMMKLYQKIFLANKALLFFMTNNWKIETENSDILRSLMHPKDREIFPFDMRGFDLPAYVVLSVAGIKKYIMNEEISEAALAKSIKKQRMFKYLHYILKGAFYLLVGWILRTYILMPTFRYITNYTVK